MSGRTSASAAGIPAEALPASGFSWCRVSKLEHQLIDLRHIQHHAAQLADRLRKAEDIGIRWVGAGSGAKPGTAFPSNEL